MPFDKSNDTLADLDHRLTAILENVDVKLNALSSRFEESVQDIGRARIVQLSSGSVKIVRPLSL